MGLMLGAMFWMNVGMKMGFLILVPVVRPRRTEVYVGMAVLPFGKVVVQHRPQGGHKEGA